MPVLLPRQHCLACGQTHDLTDASHSTYTAGAAYTYTCPATQLKVSFFPSSSGVIADPDPVSVPMRRLDES